jgi:SAM-dependent methyltransferase
MDMADMYESATVTGVDVAPVQGNWVPPNCSFEVLDIEDEWLFKEASFDFIHARELLMSIRNWEGLFAQALKYLKPGGWFEVGGSYPRPVSDDGSLAHDASLVEISDLFFQMGEKMGTVMDAPLRWKQQLEEAGFVDITQTVFVIPQGPWPKDKRLKKVGAFEHHSLMLGFEAYLMRGYTAILGGKPEELMVTLAQTRKELNDPKVHSYIHYYNVCARKPPEAVAER